MDFCSPGDSGKEYDMNSPEGKTAFHKEAAKRLTMFEEEIERNNYIEAVAEKYRIGYEELKKLVGKMAIQMGQATPAERQNRRRTGKSKRRWESEVSEDITDVADRE